MALRRLGRLAAETQLLSDMSLLLPSHGCICPSGASSVPPICQVPGRMGSRIHHGPALCRGQWVRQALINHTDAVKCTCVSVWVAAKPVKWGLGWAGGQGRLLKD